MLHWYKKDMRTYSSIVGLDRAGLPAVGLLVVLRAPVGEAPR